MVLTFNKKYISFRNKFFIKKFQNLSSLYFSFISGTIGLLFTVYLKLSLSDSLYIFKYNADTFNVILTGHAVIMSFFFQCQFFGRFRLSTVAKSVKIKSE